MASSNFGFGTYTGPADEPEIPDDASSYVLDRGTAGVQKTPISFLQEMCTKKTTKPEYELLSTEGQVRNFTDTDGQVHEPTFMYRVTVGDLSAVGQGKSKKIAKHLAAKALLERIIAVGRHSDYGLGDTPEEAMETLSKLAEPIKETAGPNRGSGSSETTNALQGSGGSDDGDSDGPGNPVGRLQEFCQKKKLPAPAYEMLSEEGMPHERTFVIRTTLLKFTADGVGRSKRHAKKDAAEKLLKILDKIPEAERRETLGYAEEDDLAETGGTEAIVQQPFGELDEHFTNMALTDNTAAIRAVTDEEKCGFKNLAEMDLNNMTPGSEHFRLLKLIGEEENWEPEFYPLPRRSQSGDYQCLVQLNAMPVAVCYGRGPSPDEAKQSAAFNALEYLKLMTKN